MHYRRVCFWAYRYREENLTPFICQTTRGQRKRVRTRGGKRGRTETPDNERRKTISRQKKNDKKKGDVALRMREGGKGGSKKNHGK